CRLIYTAVCRFFFFFQAEDGIRDFHVTGVQTLLFRSLRAEARQGHDADCSPALRSAHNSSTRGPTTPAPLPAPFLTGRWGNLYGHRNSAAALRAPAAP